MSVDVPLQLLAMACMGVAEAQPSLPACLMLRSAHCRHATAILRQLACFCSALLLPPHGPLPAADQEVEGSLPASWDGGLGLLAASPAESEDEGDRAELGGGRQTSGQLGGGSGEIPAAPSGPAEGLAGSPGSTGKAGAAPDGPSSPVADGDSSSSALAAPACPGNAAIAAAAGDGTAAGEDGSSSAEVSATWQTVRLIWAPMAALSLSSTVALTLFPFFTYVPTSGLLGESLPKVRCAAGPQVVVACFVCTFGHPVLGLLATPRLCARLVHLMVLSSPLGPLAI